MQDLNEMIFKATNGQWACFDEMYDQMNPLLRRLIYRWSGANHLDDLLQQTFLNVCRGLSRFKKKSSLKTFVIKIAHNTVIDHFRSQKKHEAHLSSEDQISETTGPENLLHQRIIMDCLNELPQEQRVALTLSVFEDFSLKEIAEICDTKEGTIKSRLHQARETLQQQLQYKGIML